MFKAKFVSRNSGTSKKTGAPWYQLDLIAQTLSGNAKVLQVFCSAIAFEATADLPAMADVSVSCGVSDNGYLTVSGVSYVELDS